MVTFDRYSLTILLVLVGLLTVGCTSSATIETNIEPGIDTAQRSNESVAVVYGSGLREAVISIGASGNECGIHTYRVGNLGESLAEGLKNAVGSGYRSVTVEESVPTNGKYDRVFQFNLVWNRPEVSFLQDPLGYMKASAKTSLSVDLKVYDGSSDSPFKTESFTSKGQFSKRAMCADGHKPLAVSSKAAVRKLSEEVAKAVTADI